MDTPAYINRNRCFCHARFCLGLLAGFLLGFMIIFAGCSSDSSGPPPSTSVPIVVFSDVHFTPFYDPDIFFDLVNAPPDRWTDIFNSSSITEPQSWGKESNYPLLLKMLQAAQEPSQGSPLVLFTGDILAHKFPETFFALYGEEDETALQAFVYKTCAFFAAQVREHIPDLPIMFILGNNDSYAGDYRLIPGGKFLSDTADLFYSTFLLGEADPEGFNQSYRAGGYYKAQPASSKVLFICLNTVLFSVNWSSPGGDDAPLTQLAWLEKTLADARAEGKKAWLLLHVPPGADVYATVSHYMDSGGRISDAVMMWKPDYQESFLDILFRYEDTIEAAFSGHTHMDEYRIALDKDRSPFGMFLNLPAVSPQYGNNPGFKVLTLSPADWEIQDYRAVALPFQNPEPVFEYLYAFSSAYHIGLPVEAGLLELTPLLVTGAEQREKFIHYYYTGHDGGNPINDTKWPAYWCATHTMSKTDYMRCVNSY